MVKTNVVIMSFFTYQSNIDIQYVHTNLIGIGLILTFSWWPTLGIGLALGTRLIFVKYEVGINRVLSQVNTGLVLV
jgi:hypothetical protein